MTKKDPKIPVEVVREELDNIREYKFKEKLDESGYDAHSEAYQGGLSEGIALADSKLRHLLKEYDDG